MLCASGIGWLLACSADTPARDSSTEGPCQASPSSARRSCSSSRIVSSTITPTPLTLNAYFEPRSRPARTPPTGGSVGLNPCSVLPRGRNLEVYCNPKLECTPILLPVSRWTVSNRNKLQRFCLYN